MNLLKRIINGYPQYSFENIIMKLKDYDIVSFDIYDTLLKRDVNSPVDVFLAISRNIGSSIEFVELRKQSEQFAKQNKNCEITIFDIYKEILGKSLTLNGSKIVITEEIVQQLIEEELATEEKLTTINLEFMKIYNWCLEQNKTIYIISDMYLPSAFLEKLLRKNGYVGFEKLYVSSEYGKTKSNGSLFEVVVQENKLNKRNMIHIGDSKKGDFIEPLMLGIQVLNIARIQKNCEFFHTSNELYPFINNRVAKEETYIRRIGYEVYGPLLYCFSEWLCRHLSPEKDVLFFARDCYVVEKAMRILNQGMNSNFHYFLASRKSLTPPAMSNISDPEDICFFLKSASREFTLGDLILLLNIQSDYVYDIIKEKKLSLEMILKRDSLFENRMVYDLIKDLLPIIREKGAQEAKNFINYFDSLKIKKAVQVVDIGWRCTMQKCLETISETEINGYYFGVREDAHIGQRAKGLFLNHEDSEEKRNFIAANVALLEMFFTAPQGSVEGYTNEGNVIFSNSVKNKNEEIINKNITSELQDGALDFVKDYFNTYGHKVIKIETSVEGIMKLGGQPHAKDISSLGVFYFETGAKTVQVVAPKSVMFYTTHISQLKKDFIDSPWKIGFLKRLIKLPIDYRKIFSLLYARRNRK
ncbi:hypothetical protein C0033_17650 [Clostridium sp. chh4-2]|uniref:hypothetical protein n=1 Tax=Clostridium sp. chh4-2 TaxID=2067550 RepID=UPI000CCFAFDB|nr:hypothetical protein [Clostridium sp. chh4-2]PNV60590.1 hypothetical protein C0033_17650 [Clostridium sp. chh4-2]